MNNSKGKMMTGLLIILAVAALFAGIVTVLFSVFLGDKSSALNNLKEEEAVDMSADEEPNDSLITETPVQEPIIVYEEVLSPRLRFERSDTTCYISRGRRQDSFPCKMERRADGTVEEYKLFPTGALNRTTYNPAGEVLEMVGLNPDDTVSFRREGNKFWFFDGPNGTVSQQTVILGQVPPGTYRQAADVIFYNPDGTVRECNCYKSDCCANPMYSLEGKPNTYCTMYPLDKDICEYKKQDNSLPPLPQEANPPQLPISSNSRRK